MSATAEENPLPCRKLALASRAVVKSVLSLALLASFQTEKKFVDMHFFVACVCRDCILHNVNCSARTKERASL